jgi:hypothetical protein
VLEGQPADAVWVQPRVGDQVPGDAREPSDAEGVEAGQLEAVVQVRRRLVLRSMRIVDQFAVEAALQRQPVAVGPKTGQCRGVRVGNRRRRAAA